MKKVVFVFLLVGILVLLTSNFRIHKAESPSYYTVQPHPVEDTVHVIIPVLEVSK